MRVLSSLLTLALASTGLASPLPTVVGKDEKLQVAAGESLYELGLRYGLAIEHFAFANRLPVQLAVPSARELTIPSRRILPRNAPPDGLVVNLPERGVFLFREGKFERFYPVAIGQPGRFATPTGQFKLISLVKNPTWMPPEWAGMGPDAVVPAGPDNPLGDRWMGLSLPGVGLHSTTQPASIGAAESHGCMRMYPQMARELFDRLEIGFPVRIEYETVKLGRDPETGSLCISFFPDVYGVQPLLPRAQDLLEQASMASWVESRQLELWARQARGMPHLFADGQVSLMYQGTDISESGLLLRSNQGVYLSSEALRRLGFATQFQSESRSLLVTRGEVSQTLPLDSSVNLDGRLYLPARATLATLGLAVTWDSTLKALVVD